ncbi:MAG: ABC transporter substrate-binding protein [Candidatus Methylarchaceae archaeon HK01M]|nr:ABC transporter substrate-binding protein [Candidatus Methylarchaceae archaeon HK01M]
MIRVRSISKPIVALIIVGVLVTGIFVGYYLGFSTKPSGLEPVRIGYLVGDIHQIEFYTAYAQGWYEEEGIAPIKKEYLYGMPEMMDFAAGELDAGYVGCVPALIMASKGAEIVILSSSNEEGSAIVAKPEINSIEELDGKIVGHPGLGSIQSVMIKMVAEEFNVTPTYIDYSITELPLALERGDIDAYIAWEPFCAEAVVRGIGHIIYTSHDIYPDHQCCVFYVSKQLYDERPEIVKKLLKVHVKGLNYIQENSTDAIQSFASLTGRDVDVCQECWQRMVWGYHVNRESMITFTDAMIDQGKISAEDVPDATAFVNDLIDEILLNEVITEIDIT